MNLPKEVKEVLNITESKGKILFVFDGKQVIVQKA
jgi:hypothetical protein